jgi:hypothetical protein
VYADHSYENRSVVDSADVARGLEHLQAIGARLQPATPTERKTEPLPAHLTFVARCHRGDSVPLRSEDWTRLPEVLARKKYESMDCMPCTDPELGPLCLDCTNDNDLTLGPDFPRLKPGFTRFDRGGSPGAGLQGFEGADIYSCLSGEHLCFPEINSPTGLVLGEYRCAYHPGHCCESEKYDGYLCQTCAADHHWAEDGLSCQECSVTYLLIPIVLAFIIVLAIGLLAHPRTGPRLLAVLLKFSKRCANELRRCRDGATAAADTVEFTKERQLLLQATVRSTWQPVRILVSYAQVVTQLGPVLDVKYPTSFQKWISWLESLSFSLDVFNSKCLFPENFISRWFVTVFVVPGFLLLFVLLRYLWKRRRTKRTGLPDTTNHAGSLFFVIFLM